MKYLTLITLLLVILGCQTMKKSNHLNIDEHKLSNLDYLTEIEGSKALEFARVNNQISDQRLKTDKRYQTTYDEIFKIVSAKDKLPGFFVMQDTVYSFWQDDVHIKGILRKTTIESFNTGKPAWSVILDIDLLAKNENENWVYKGFNCLDPDYTLCLIHLSRGGKDAGIYREFNLKTNEFVENGFYLPESKSDVAWIDEDTILVGDATNSSTLTTSGYPSQIKVLKRGADINTAELIFKTNLNSMSAYAYTKLVDQKRYIFIIDQTSFFESTKYIFDLNTTQLTKIPIPTTAKLESIYQDQIFFSTRKNFLEYPAGSLLSFNLNEINNQNPKISSIFIPTSTSFYQYSQFSKNHLWVVTLTDVRKQVFKFSYKNERWNSEPVKIKNSTGDLSIDWLDDQSEHIYFHYTDFLTPTSIYYVNESQTQIPKAVMSTPARFKSDPFHIVQYKVKSKDGTLIPYFVISNKKLKLNSTNPTLVYAYGGFEIALTPSYLGATGKVWLEKGGVYVLANIRGGGEYGPNWHLSVLRENRKKVYEDFYAVLEDLISRKITTPRHLGIRGGSNGGLLTSVAFTQKPELFNAVISEVPLANMLDYHKWLAGASWMEEYGNPDDPKMRDYLLSYSPLHNLKKNIKYPEVFYITSTKDDRVSPAHARQMVARLQELGHPVLYNENTDGGHGRASNMKDLAEYLALEFTYLYQKLF